LKLKEYCKRENITLRSIAENVGIPYNYFAHCASGKEKFSYQRAKRVSEYCHGEVTVDDLIPYVEPKRCSECNRILPKIAKKKPRGG